MSKRDYYEILGVDRQVSEGDLKKSYRKLAMEFHPDRNPGDSVAEDKFKELSEAYAVLSDAQKRQAYDQYGHAGVSGAGGAQDFGDLGGFADIFGDLFGDMFGGSRGGRGRGQRGADLRYNLDIDLDDVLNGTKPSLDIPKTKACDTCEGSGARPGTSKSAADAVRVGVSSPSSRASFV